MNCRIYVPPVKPEGQARRCSLRRSLLFRSFDADSLQAPMRPVIIALLRRLKWLVRADGGPVYLQFSLAADAEPSHPGPWLILTFALLVQ